LTWVESAEENRSSRFAKCNKYMRRIFTRAAHAEARSKGPHFQTVFRVCCLDWAIYPSTGPLHIASFRLVSKILHKAVRYIEQGTSSEPKFLIHRAKHLAQQPRKFGNDLRVTGTSPENLHNRHRGRFSRESAEIRPESR
jgi:hypothetical protein